MWWLLKETFCFISQQWPARLVFCRPSACGNNVWGEFTQLIKLELEWEQIEIVIRVILLRFGDANTLRITRRSFMLEGHLTHILRFFFYQPLPFPVLVIHFLLINVRRFLHSYHLINSIIQLDVLRCRSTLPQLLCLLSLKSLKEDSNVIPDWSLFHNKARIFDSIEIFCDLLPQRTTLNGLFFGTVGVDKNDLLTQHKVVQRCPIDNSVMEIKWASDSGRYIFILDLYFPVAPEPGECSYPKIT